MGQYGPQKRNSAEPIGTNDFRPHGRCRKIGVGQHDLVAMSHALHRMEQVGAEQRMNATQHDASLNGSYGLRNPQSRTLAH